MLWPIDLYFIHEFFLPTMSLKYLYPFYYWKKCLPNILTLFTYYYPHPQSSLIFFKSEKKVTCKTLSKQLVFFLFHVLKLVFLFFLNKTTQDKSKLRNGKNQEFFLFCFLSCSPLFSASKRENINGKNKKTNNTW